MSNEILQASGSQPTFRWLPHTGADLDSRIDGKQTSNQPAALQCGSMFLRADQARGRTNVDGYQPASSSTESGTAQ